MKALQKRVRLVPEDAVYTGMFDSAKGIFILGMFFLHSFNSYYSLPQTTENLSVVKRIVFFLFNLLGTPQVPMLFMICGYGWRRKTMKKALNTQVSSLAPTYFAVPAVIALILIAKKLILGGNLLQDLEYNVLNFLFGYPSSSIPFLGLNMAFIGPMWFIVCYFFSSLLLNAILWIDEEWMRWIAVLLLSCLGILFKDTNTVWFLQQSLICTGFMYIGWEIKKKNFLKKEVPRGFLLAAIAMAIWMTAVGRVDIVQHIWKNGLMDVFDAALTGVLLMLLMLRLNAIQGKIFNALRWLGRHIFQICAIHTVTLLILHSRLSLRFSGVRPLGFLAEFLLHLAASVLFTLLIEIARKRIARHRRKSA